MNNKYDYLTVVTNDVEQWIYENISLEEYENDRATLEKELNADLWEVDAITGGFSNTYTRNSFDAKNYVMDNLDLLADVIDESGGYTDMLREGAEACDVAIRCYILPEAIRKALDELEVY